MVTLLLRTYRRDDETQAVAAHGELADEGFEFLWGYDPAGTWSDYLSLVDAYAQGRDLPEGHVPGALLAAEVDGLLVGRVSIRFALNDVLRERGGHIGYAVRREFRGRGFATQILRQSLLIAHERGVDPVLVVCDNDNLASATVIERCGGVLDTIVADAPGATYRRYWIHSARRD